MQTEYMRKCSLCLLQQSEVAPFMKELKMRYPHVEMALFPSVGTLQLMFQSEREVDGLVEEVKKQFPTFFLGDESLEMALHREFTLRKKRLAIAESCTGGLLAAKITAMAGASNYFLGSIVAYSNVWKERFLQVSHTTLKEKGAVSREVVTEMVEGLLSETDADFAVAVSGIAGPSGGTSEKPVGTMYIAVGERGKKIDAGLVFGPKEGRADVMELAVHTTMGALWRRLVHNTATFS